jgi:hypothetical protein
LRKKSSNIAAIQTRRLIDLSFLTPPNGTANNGPFLGEAQFSLVICGSDNYRWTAYAFVDENDSIFSDLATNESLVMEDPIARADRAPVDANFPIWDPREYFLVILENRIAQILKEWRNVVRWLERTIADDVC